MSRKEIQESPASQRGQLPGDYKPMEADDSVADTLARVYALILSWPAVDAQEPRNEANSI